MQICLFLVFVATLCLVCEIFIKKCWRRTYKINSKSLFIFCFYQKTSSHVHLCVRFNRYLCCLVWHLLCVVCMIKESSFWRKDLLLTGQGLQIPIFSVQRDLTACLSMSLLYSVVCCARCSLSISLWWWSWFRDDDDLGRRSNDLWWNTCELFNFVANFVGNKACPSALMKRR